MVPLFFGFVEFFAQKIYVDLLLLRASNIQLIMNNTTITTTNFNFPGQVSVYRGKVREVYNINNQLLVQAVVPAMKKAGFGRIVNIISTSVKQPIVGLGVSNTIRWAVASWAKTLSLEIGKFGITVNNVLPGFTLTGRLTEVVERRAATSGQTIESVWEMFKSNVPANRFAEPKEVAAAVAFLASPAAGYINGINLPVDGGRTKSL